MRQQRGQHVTLKAESSTVVIAGIIAAASARAVLLLWPMGWSKNQLAHGC
jgi:hypothetical protein